MKIELPRCGPEFYQNDVTVKSGDYYDTSGVVCGIVINGEEAQFLESELDELISALELIRKNI